MTIFFGVESIARNVLIILSILSISKEKRRNAYSSRNSSGKKRNETKRDETRRDETERNEERKEKKGKRDSTLSITTTRAHTVRVYERGEGEREETPKVTSTPAKRYPMEADRSFLLPVPLPPSLVPPSVPPLYHSSLFPLCNSYSTAVVSRIACSSSRCPTVTRLGIVSR